MSNRRASLTFGALGVLLVIAASVIMDAFGVPSGPWWVVLCVAFVLFMFRVPTLLGRSKTD